ncbi:MAG: LysM peptidoglycan-binding domain-containing protein, partial [Treponema sp.]|nr:LysM peptidoglycan-binding domain-containing protein [Treponema sp.]
APAPVPPPPAPSPPLPVAPVEQPKPVKIPLPAMYTVRPWAISKDCFWNIAGRDWAYNDSMKWQVLYNANKAKLANPNNPDLLHMDIVLDIPSIKGEVREGMWDPTKAYEPLGK